MVSRRPLAAAATLAALATLAPRLASANGDNTHAWISRHAVERLPPGGLRTFLERPELQSALLNGTVFPDGGYVVKDDYGEIAHWEPYLDAYIESIRTRYGDKLLDGAAAEEVAFLLGMASHDVADQTFDSMFLERAMVHDAAGWSDELFDSIDTASDVIAVADTGESLDIVPKIPYDALVAVYKDPIGYEVTASVLRQGQDLLDRLVINYGRVTGTSDPDRLAGYRVRYPWANEHLLDTTTACGPHCEADIIAAYWQVIWDRLFDESEAQNDLVATHPRDGAAGHPVDHTQIDAEVVLVLGFGVVRDSLAGKVTAVDDTGHSYDLAVTTWRSESNVVRIAPREDWGADRDITVTVAAGVQLIGREPLAAPYVLHFSTRAGDPGLPVSDPTPHVGEPAAGIAQPPAPPETGGCSVASGAGDAGAVGLALVAIALLRRRYSASVQES